jgi:hypothetical protein
LVLGIHQLVGGTFRHFAKAGPARVRNGLRDPRTSINPKRWQETRAAAGLP